MPRRPPVGPRTQSWTTFLRNHAGAVLACDFFVVVTASFQRVYVFVILDIATRQIVHWNLTRHPTTEWAIQQFWDGLPIDGPYRFVVHDRDGIFGPAVDDALGGISLRVLKTPPGVPQANAYVERFIGTARRECLDWMIPLHERHLRPGVVGVDPPLQRRTPTFGLRSGSAGRTVSPGIADRPQPAAGASRRCQCSARRTPPPLPPGKRRRVNFYGAQPCASTRSLTDGLLSKAQTRVDCLRAAGRKSSSEPLEAIRR
jgi:transposase InsO family protein